MGSENSKDKEKSNNIIMNNSTSNFTKDNCSSYNGIRSESSENPRKSLSYASSTSEHPDNLETPSDTKVPTTFEWKEDGNVVSVTGSFCNWSQFFIMNKDKDGVFRLTLSLPKAFHQYKFYVDNQWRYSTLFPIHNDNNNLNNYIDTSNWEPPGKKHEIKEVLTNNKEVTNTNKEINDDYSEYYPQKHELNTDAQPIPQQYINSFNLDHNTKQHLLGNNKFYNRSERNLLSENNSFKQIGKPPHVNLNHSHSKILNGQKYNTVLVSCTSRVRYKFTTVIYYRPSNNLSCL